MPAEASPRKPANIVYALDEAPPLLVTAGNAVQHVALISINFVYPLLIFRLADVPVSGVASLLAVGLMVLGAGHVSPGGQTGAGRQWVPVPGDLHGCLSQPVAARRQGGRVAAIVRHDSVCRHAGGPVLAVTQSSATLFSD